MGLQIYNSLSRKLEDFAPLNAERVTIYNCGPTVYDYIHMGNARTALVTDIIRRYLTHKGYNVKLAQNLTDIDDKIIARAAELGISEKQLAQQRGDAFLEDSLRLGIQPADVHPKATEHIPEMLTLIQRLIDKGAAYVIDGSVYYRVNAFAEYGKLSHRKPEDLLAGARVEIDERKEDPRDFDLWKAAKPGEPTWDSPWGKGRPGWHIECSAMAMKHLGETLDMHVAGEDLLFPHNENEIAQSELATGKPFARYWVHVAFLKIDGRRMGKSERNFILLRDALDNYPTEVIRHFLISAQYRHPLDYNPESLAKSEGALRRLNNCLAALETYQTADAADVEGEAETALRNATLQMKADFQAAMDADFNTARALGAIFTLIGAVNRFIQQTETDAAAVLAHAREALIETCGVLGIYNAQDSDVQDDSGEMLTHLVTLLLDIRQDARQRKDWETSDKIRDRMKELNIEIQDTRQGATWKFIS
ncbi:cysteine--tRNA ligase [Candidatus Poribacteria bacterium]|nr:MAG: cysteine--tRNA ligase [Candidatus Poribacteria bacterium]